MPADVALSVCVRASAFYRFLFTAPAAKKAANNDDYGDDDARSDYIRSGGNIIKFNV